MTDTDIMVISILFNVILLFHNWLMHKRYETVGTLFAKTIHIMGAIADGKAMAQRDSKGEIRIKDLRNETN
jgi:hypothetical protein